MKLDTTAGSCDANSRRTTCLGVVGFAGRIPQTIFVCVRYTGLVQGGTDRQRHTVPWHRDGWTGHCTATTTRRVLAVQIIT
eukprot:m.852559 g.852559  ORF g.852559 m.852559 type:complete len:81 (-) comp23496_c0_seq17:2671-2913(-)